MSFQDGVGRGRPFMRSYALATSYIDRDSGRIVTILGYPVRRIAEWG